MFINLKIQFVNMLNEPNKTFVHLETRAAINDLIHDKQVIIPTGAFFGDEAKGKTVDSIGSHEDVTIIARVNSGENAGHTVYHNSEKFVFHLLPSGIFTGKKIIISDNCVMDPLSFYSKEIKPLIEKGIDTSNIFIGNVTLVFPWHKISDALRDPNASTGKGMSQVHSDIRRKNDLTIETIINRKYELISSSLEYWWNEISPKLTDEVVEKLILNNQIPIDIKKFLNAKTHEIRLKLLIESYEGEVRDFLVKHYANTTQIMIDELEKDKKVILEGPQSYYLSNGVDTHHKSSTSAETHATGIFASSNLPPKYTNNTLTINVHKAPGSSRVGSGANPSGYVDQNWFSKKGYRKENLPKDIDLNDALKQFVKSIDENGLQDSKVLYKNQNGETYDLNEEKLTVNEALAIAEVMTYGEFGATTGKPRITGGLDLPHLKNLKKFQQGKLSISCLDRADGLSYMLLITGYIYDGETYNYKGRVYENGCHITLDDNLAGEEVLKNCRAVYEVLDGWQKAASLEPNVQRYLSRIEELTKMNIISIGIGPETNQIMYLRKE